MLQFAPVYYWMLVGDAALGRSNNGLRAKTGIQKLNWLGPDHGNPETVLSKQKDVLSPSLFSGCRGYHYKYATSAKKVKWNILPYNLLLNISVLNPQADSWGPEPHYSTPRNAGLRQSVFNVVMNMQRFGPVFKGKEKLCGMDWLSPFVVDGCKGYIVLV